LKNKIILLHKEKKIFELKINLSRKSILGDCDILLNSGKGMYFDHVILGNYFRYYKLPKEEVDSLSWHGYYEIVNPELLNAPVVHIKSHGKIIDRVFHFGSINYSEPFAFPVCSIYIPYDLNTDVIGRTKKSLQADYIEVPIVNENLRFDFFVLPKGMPIKRFKRSQLMIMYRFADLDIFNNTSEGYNIVPDAEMEEIKREDNNDILVRIVKDPSNIIIENDSGEQIFKEVCGQYSLIVNDPNDIYNKLTNRLVAACDEDGNMMQLQLLKEIHEKQIDFDPTFETNIWDTFYN